MINKRYDFYYRSEEKWQTSKLMLGKRIKLPVYLSGILCHQTMSRMLSLANRYNHHLVWASANTLLFYFQQFPSPALQKLSDKNANWNITNYLESLMDSWVVKTFRKMEKLFQPKHTNSIIFSSRLWFFYLFTSEQAENMKKSLFLYTS